jgi:predicted GTPase
MTPNSRRVHGRARYDGRQFEIIDTGGIVQDEEYIPSQILKQAGGALYCVI